MRRYKLGEFKKGYPVGAFEPVALHTDLFEFGLKHHKQGSVWPKHKQRIATEINIMVHGRMRVNQDELAGDIFKQEHDVFVVEPEEATEVFFHTDCVVAVAKTPSLPSDKVVV